MQCCDFFPFCLVPLCCSCFSPSLLPPSIVFLSPLLPGSQPRSQDLSTVFLLILMNVTLIINDILFRFKGHTNKDYKVDSCLSSSDAQVISGSEDGRICFWDLVEAKIVHTLEKAHQSVVYSISYHPTEICLLSASSDGKVKVWHDSNWEPEWLALSEDNRTLTAMDTFILGESSFVCCVQSPYFITPMRKIGKLTDWLNISECWQLEGEMLCM